MRGEKALADVGRHLGKLVLMLSFGFAHLLAQQWFGQRGIIAPLPCRELTATVLLVIEVVLTQQLVATLL